MGSDRYLWPRRPHRAERGLFGVHTAARNLELEQIWHYAHSAVTISTCKEPEVSGSLLTSISSYYITDKDDFESRLEKLSDKDLKYLAERAMDGS